MYDSQHPIIPLHRESKRQKIKTNYKINYIQNETSFSYLTKGKKMLIKKNHNPNNNNNNINSDSDSNSNNKAKKKHTHRDRNGRNYQVGLMKP